MPASLIAIAASLAAQPVSPPPLVTVQQPLPPTSPSRIYPMPVPPAPPPPPPPPSPRSTPPRLLSGSISDADYPSAAIRDQAEGTVQVLLNVGADGLPTACEVSASSGHATLDARTCELLARRLRFRPATIGGNPVPSRWSQRVTWLLPEGPLIAFAQGRFDWTVTVSTAGATECRIALTGRAFERFDEGQCDEPDGEWMAVREDLGAGHPPVRLRNVLSVLPEGVTSNLPRLAGAPMFEWTGDVEIDFYGRVTRCTTIAAQGTAPDYAYFPFMLGCESVQGRLLFAHQVGAPVRRARLGSTLFVDVIVPPR